MLDIYYKNEYIVYSIYDGKKFTEYRTFEEAIESIYSNLNNKK